jgi:hypothetical protein
LTTIRKDRYLQTPEEDAAALRLAVASARTVAENLHRRLVDLTAELSNAPSPADRAMLDELARDAETAAQLAARLDEVLRAVEASLPV